VPRVLKTGDQINGYRITEHLNTGAMANAFAAESREGRKVFFKQYKSPSVAVKWFQPYVDYQKELNRRIKRPDLSRFCVHQLDSFVERFGMDTFFQVYEFVEGGHDLGSVLNKVRENSKALTWYQRVILAKVLTAGIHQLHSHDIVHCDLKPANLQMFEDPTIEARFQLKLIDMDFSVLADRPAPWHGHAPYVGSPRYFSPEHLRGEVPGPQSDIFTCGLILYELLADGHPYPAADEAAYCQKINAYSVAHPRFVASLTTMDATACLAEIIHRCLSPDPSQRPTAKAVNLALNAKAPIIEKKPEHPSNAPTPEINSLRLVGPDGKSLPFNVGTQVGKSLFRRFWTEARFADNHQFTLERRGDEWWLLPPENETKNLTIVNGKQARTAVQLKQGDKIEICGKASGKTALPLIVDI
jgi:serine/threonine protein kinase